LIREGGRSLERGRLLIGEGGRLLEEVELLIGEEGRLLIREGGSLLRGKRGRLPAAGGQSWGRKWNRWLKAVRTQVNAETDKKILEIFQS